MKSIVALAISCLFAVNPALAVLTGTEGLNDASRIVKCGKAYFWYSTGAGIKMRWTTAPETGVWNAGPEVFPVRPSWWKDWNAKGSAWAPDVIYHPGRKEYLLYYCLSTSGINTSAIGLAVNKTLDPNDPAYAWVDKGIVISTRVGVDDCNALDPCPVRTADNEWYLCFGSFRGGVKLIRLSEEGLRHPVIKTRWNLARKERSPKNECEAGSIYPGLKNGVAGYWLFVNWGGGAFGGEKSTYQIRVGWSPSVHGPYLDKRGVDMFNGGGTPFMNNRQTFPTDGSTRIGRGHVGLITHEMLDGKHPDWVSYSYWLHDSSSGGGLRFGLQQWNTAPDGWPEAGPVFLAP